VQQYPLTDTSIRGAIDQRVQQMGWSLEQRSRFVLELFERPEAALTQADWELLLFELQSGVMQETPYTDFFYLIARIGALGGIIPSNNELCALVREPELYPCRSCERNAVPIHPGTNYSRTHGGIDHHRNACRSAIPSNNPRSAIA